MAFNNLFSPQNFTLGNQAPSQPQAQPQQQVQPTQAGPMGGQQFPTPAQEFQFYQGIFNVLDTEKKKALNGGQVFNFFLSSGLTKAVLADIWDAVKQNGVLVVASFVKAMKLITLAQNNMAPQLANLNSVQYIGPPRLQYPPNTRLLVAPGTIFKGNVQPQAAPGNQGGGGADPFGALNLGLGGGAAAQPVAKPAGPTWTTGDVGTSGGTTGTSSPQMSGTSQQNSSYNVLPQPSGGMTATAAIAASANANQYAPSSALKSHVRGQSTRQLMSDPKEYMSGDESGGLPSLGRQQSRRMMADERAREELRAANQREKMARQGLNEARITNERLERENEQLRSEVKEAREAQAQALKQSSEALQSIQPLRVENEKLKEAIREWQELIQTKDQDFEQLEVECEDIRAQNEQLKSETRQVKETMDELTYQVDSIKSKLEESEKDNKRNLREISNLKDEKLKIESEKRDLDIEIVKLQSQVKTLKRDLQKLSEAKSAREKESDMFGALGGGAFAPSSQERRGRRSTTGSRSRSPIHKAASQPQNAPVDVMLGGPASHKSDASNNSAKRNSGLSVGAAATANKTDDLFSGLSYDTPAIAEEPKKTDDDFGSSFPMFNENKVIPPASNGGPLDIGPVAPVSGDLANGDINLASGDSGSEYDEIDVEELVNENYQVEEKKMVTVPKEVKVVEMADVDIPVSPSDVTPDGKYSGQGTYGSSPYFLSLKIFNANRGHFVNSDKDKDGKLNVKEAWEFFQLAKMETSVLQNAWKLVAVGHNDPDLPKDGLSEIQFHCMFQIILTMKRNKTNECPSSIPDALNFDVIRMLGKPVVNGNVTIRKTTEVVRTEPTQEERTVMVTKQRPVKKMVKKRVKKKGGKKSKKSKNKGGNTTQSQMASAANEVPPPLPSNNDDDFGFGDDDAPGAAPTNTMATNNNNNNAKTDDWGADFGNDDWGTNNNDSNANKKSDKKEKEKKTDNFIDDDGFGGGGTTTAGGDGDWENWGAF